MSLKSQENKAAPDFQLLDTLDVKKASSYPPTTGVK